MRMRPHGQRRLDQAGHALRMVLSVQTGSRRTADVSTRAHVPRALFPTCKDAMSEREPPANVVKIARRLRRAMDDLLDVARSEGVRRPVLFIEGEAGVYVVDRDAEPEDDRATAGERQVAVVWHVCHLPPGSDVGAW